MTTDTNLDKFIDEIIDARQLPGLTPEVRVQVHADLMNQLHEQINAALVRALSPDKLDQLNELLDDAAVSDETLMQFIEQAGVDTKKIAADTMLRFRDLYLSATGT